MSNRLLNLVLGTANVGGPARRHLLATLANHANDAGRCWPSMALLQAETELSPSTLNRACEDLERDGWLLVERKSVGALHRGTAYILVAAKLEASQRTPVTVTHVDKLKADLTGVTVTGVHTNTPVTVTPVHLSPCSNTPVTVTGVLEPPRTSTGTNDKGKDVPLAITPDSSRTWHATAMLANLGIVSTKSTAAVLEAAIALHASETGETFVQARTLLEGLALEAQRRGESLNRFWFEDSKWKGAGSGKPNSGQQLRDEKHRRWAMVGVSPQYVSQAETSHSPEFVNKAASSPTDLDGGERLLKKISNAVKSKVGEQRWSTWVRPIRQTGIVDGEFCLTVPNSNFEDVPTRFAFEGYLPSSVRAIRVTVAEAN